MSLMFLTLSLFLYTLENTDEHTAGCLLVGDSQENNQLLPDGFIGKSVNAYKRIYPSIAKAIANGEEVTITYKDYD